MWAGKIQREAAMERGGLGHRPAVAVFYTQQRERAAVLVKGLLLPIYYDIAELIACWLHCKWWCESNISKWKG